MNLFLYIVGDLFHDLLKLASPIIFIALVISLLWLGDNLFSIVTSVFPFLAL